MREREADKAAMATRRIEWRGSGERKSFVAWLWVFGGVWAIVLTVAILTVGEIESDDYFKFGALGVLAGVTVSIFYAFIRQYYYQAFDDRMVLGDRKRLSQFDAELADTAASGDIDLPSLWASNQNWLSVYHGRADSQSKRSFANGQIAASIGFLVVVGAACFAAFTGNSAGAVAAGVIGVAGAALSGYVGSTFMKTQSEASAQLREYFLHPVEVSRLLTAERLLMTLPEGQRQEGVNKIIDGILATHARSNRVA